MCHDNHPAAAPSTISEPLAEGRAQDKAAGAMEQRKLLGEPRLAGYPRNFRSVLEERIRFHETRLMKLHSLRKALPAEIEFEGNDALCEAFINF